MVVEVKTIEHYDVIGFDMDFCLINYNKHNLLRLMYYQITNFLTTQKGYIDLEDYESI